jgi:hypothetical protein
VSPTALALLLAGVLAAPRTEAESARAKGDDPFLGALVDAGVPDGIGVSLSLRPLSFARFELGGMGNGVSAGLRAGLALVPFDSVIRPSLTFEAGRYFQGDASWVLGADAPAEARGVLSAVSYDFATAHVGFELGSRNIAFFLRAGASYVDVSVPGLPAEVPPALQPLIRDRHLRTPIPSAKLGLVVFFL